MLLLLLACSATPNGGGSARGPADSAVDSALPVDSAVDSESPGETADTSPVETGETADSDAPWTLPDRPDTDSPTAADGWRHGGGAGYPDTVDPTWPVVTRVSDRAALETALTAATAGSIVWVEDEAAIDLTGASLCIPAGVWLAGGRGQGGPGGLLFSEAGSRSPMLAACGAGVRVTGLRLRGPDPDTCPPEWPSDCPNDVTGDPNCAYCTDTAFAIGTTGYDGLEVDNNELSGWTYAGVAVKNAVDADIHHNHIHHGWRQGLGYGVVLYGSDPTRALIRWNRFDALRHAVAGQGYASEDYEARDNLMGALANGHVFDMHGENEATGSGSSDAGGDIRVHRNTVLVPDSYSFVVRGKPTTGAWFYDNCVAPRAEDATLQRLFFGNFYVDLAPDGTSAPNSYEQSAGDCGTLRWCLADGLDGPVRHGSASGTAASELLVGDLDGDGRDDVFGSDGSAWRWAHPDGGSWARLATSGMGVGSLLLADLDGDGVDDVVSATSGVWRWSRSGAASWAELRASTESIGDLRVGDFDGDGRDDLFTTEGGRWRYYPGGSGEAVLLASSGSAIGDLAVGDFDGDGLADVFTADGAQWRWSKGGAASWADLAVSGETLESLRLADVDGDGVTDVLGLSDWTLRVSIGGRRSWATVRHQVEGLEDLRLGDFNGDGRVDLLTGGCL
jgi:hypothetical protein